MSKVVTSFKEVNNLGFNPEKTEELVAGLKQDGVVVGIEDLSFYIRKQGLIVQEHIGRKRNYVKVSPKVFGVDLTSKGSETNAFFKQHMKMGKMSFLPEEYETILTNIESSVRVQRNRLAIGYDSKFMLLNTYTEFMRMVDTRKAEYFATRDKIVAEWDNIIANFKVILMKTLEELGAIDKEAVYNKIVMSLPSKEDYAESFYMTISAKAFPVTENLEMFSDSVQESIKEGLNQETIQTLYEIIGSTLNDAFDNVCRVIKAIKKSDNSPYGTMAISEKVPVRTLDSVKKTATKMAQKNIFNNQKVETIRVSLLELLPLATSPEIMCEEAEAIAALIYGYSKELDVESSIDLKVSPLSENELMTLFKMVEDNHSTESEMRA